MRVLGAPDVLLSSDLIMLRSAEALGLPSTTKSLAEHGAAWAPWRSYAGLHLWRARPPLAPKRRPSLRNDDGLTEMGPVATH